MLPVPLPGSLETSHTFDPICRGLITQTGDNISYLYVLVLKRHNSNPLVESNSYIYPINIYGTYFER